MQLRKKEVVTLIMGRVSIKYFPVLACIPYSYARRMSWLSLGLGLVVSISQFWIVYHTVVRARKRSWLSLWLGLAGSIFQFLDCISYSTQEGLRGFR